MPVRSSSLLAVLAAAAFLIFGVHAASAQPIISEFMASNETTIADQNGDFADWLELYNPGTAPVNLNGWYLTNKATKLTKWKIPAVTLPAGGFLVVFCSQKNYTDPSQPLATNFNLSESGGYVALVESDGKTVASSYTFPIQYPDVSYGVSQPTNSSEQPQVGYFESATPGEPNGGASNILLTDMATISAPPGIFTGSISVTLTGASASEHIRYVLAPSSSTGDQVAPPTSSSPMYTGAISISSTTLLKAAVFSSDDSQRGLPATAMYVQLDNSTANRLDTFSSILPLVVFDDHGFGLLPDNDTYYPGWIGAFSTVNETSTLTQTPDFFTPDTTKDHGFSSAGAPKQSYDIDLADTFGNDLDQPFFGMDDEKSWDSIAVWDYDRTFIHNAFVYSLANSMGHWGPRTQFAEMFIHSAGGVLDKTSYAGVTAITDRIKVAASRVNIYSLQVDDVTAPNDTGGYMEYLHTSGILAVVAAGLYSGWRDPVRMDAETRQAASGVWSLVIYWLNGIAFVLLGLQFPGLLAAVSHTFTTPQLVGMTVAVSATAIIARIVWVFPGTYIPFLFPGVRAREVRPPAVNVLVVSWAGMRGTVTLAAALSIPLFMPDGSDFPGRAIVIFLAFGVIAVTLLVQGTTLEPLIRWLGIREDESRPKEERLARMTAVEAGLQALRAFEDTAATPDENAALGQVIAEYEQRLAVLTTEGETQRSASRRRTAGHGYRMAALKAERNAVDHLWRTNAIIDEVHHPLQELLDHEESILRGTAPGEAA
jgi:Sodium/hydrogen exchanger family/Lamin Tail Domain/CotH kinase protein